MLQKPPEQCYNSFEMGKFRRKTKSERVDEILAASTRVFNEKGFRNTTMEDIIKETSLSKGGFYHYFKSTDEILLAVMESETFLVFDLMLDELSGLERGELIGALVDMMIARILRENPEKRLFMMFLFEMLYKPDFMEKYFALEDTTLGNAEKTQHEKIPEQLAADLLRLARDERMLYLSRLNTAIIIVYHLFPGKKMMRKYIGYIETMFTRILEDILS